MTPSGNRRSEEAAAPAPGPRGVEGAGAGVAGGRRSARRDGAGGPAAPVRATLAHRPASSAGSAFGPSLVSRFRDLYTAHTPDFTNCTSGHG
ncbi:MAG: hypothetical protein BJ554DRAFT_4995 [Olpidium bornovanus]|uniref:Uncharacterized protein n=1 Tax=Olpidium bornovanus TaxID=278681 RepID=A0A8H8DED5_9FUNG|nr:MAG: hypothetical protein BJ554DRAFT_4995 [Olpidium bornovanus]